MRILVVRHGETDFNKEEKLQGVINNLLNDTGRRQARMLRARLLNEHIDYCYMSPLVRCVETAMILVGERVEMIPDKRLIERDMGNLEGMNRDLYDAKKYWDYKLNSSDENVEDIESIFKRCRDFLNYIKEKYDDDKTILIVTHVSPVRAIYHILNKTDLNSDLLIDVKNCCLFELNMKKNYNY